MLSPWELRKILLEKLIPARGLAVSLALLVEVQLRRLEEMRRTEKMREMVSHRLTTES